LGTAEDTVFVPGTLSLDSKKIKTKNMVIDSSIQSSHMEIFSGANNQDILCTLKSTNDYHADPIGYNDSFDKLEPFLYINKKTDAIDVGLNVNKVNELFPMVVNDKSINYVGLINILINELQWVKKELYKLKNPNESESLVYPKEEKVIEEEKEELLDELNLKETKSAEEDTFSEEEEEEDSNVIVKTTVDL
jgi:hypothetical protein